MAESEIRPDQNFPLFLQERLRGIAAKSSDVAIECSDVAGYVSIVSSRIEDQFSSLDTLATLVSELLANQAQLTTANDETHQITQQVRLHLNQSKDIARTAVHVFSGLVDLILRLGDRTQALMNALDQVRGVSSTINAIAEKTRFVAINAAIEAARSGEAGRGFTVVADEVKTLAVNTQRATAEITRTLDALSSEAGGIEKEVEAGAEDGESTRQRADELRKVLENTTELVNKLEEQANDIAIQSKNINSKVNHIESITVELSRDAFKNKDQLASSRKRLDHLESTSNDLLSHIFHCGIKTEDTPFILNVLKYAREVQKFIEESINKNRININDVFDNNYILIKNTNPSQYITRFVEFADNKIRPILDDCSSFDERIVGATISDPNGYMPTHTTAKSQPQGPDPTFNARYSRNRRILLDEPARVAHASNAEFVLQTYRQDLGEGRYRTVKTVRVPLWIMGRRWGIFESGYIL